MDEHRRELLKTLSLGVAGAMMAAPLGTHAEVPGAQKEAGREERERGLAGAPKRQTAGDFPAMVCSECGSRFVIKGKTTCGHNAEVREPGQARANVHPTVKPIDLMRHLVRLVTPPGGTVLDPFLGSGTTGIACEMEGFPWIGIEREPEYVAIAEARLNGVQRGFGLEIPA